MVLYIQRKIQRKLNILGAPSKCCSRKLVGGVEYDLVKEGDTSAYQCNSNCIYEKKDEKGQIFCFAAGELKVQCKEATHTRKEQPCKYLLFSNIETIYFHLACSKYI